MGSVDVTTRFTHYNSYKLDAGEELYGTPFDVEYFSAINSQAQVICKGSSATGAMYVTWLADDGSKLGRDEFEFDVTGRWVRQTWTNEPPEHAVRAMWSVKNTHASEAWNVACAMTSAGEMAGAFDPALANQVSLLTASGLYTGTVTANQVETGLLRSIDGLAYFDLDKPEIVMQGNSATWKASPENPLRLEDSSGNLIGGLVSLPKGRLALMSSVISNSADLLSGIGTVGTGPAGGAGYSFTDEGQTFVLCFTGASGVPEFGVSLFVNDQPRLSVHPGGGFSVTDPDGQDRIRVQESGVLYLIDSSDNVRYWQDAAQTFIRGVSTNHALGVDATGPYYTQGGETGYLGPRELAGASNLNNLLTPGTYYMRTGPHTNSPSGWSNRNFILRVSKMADYEVYVQEAFYKGEAVKVRTYQTSSWGAWS